MATMPNALGMQIPVGTTQQSGALGTGSTAATNTAAPVTATQSPITAAQNNVFSSPNAVTGTATNTGAVPTTTAAPTSTAITSPVTANAVTATNTGAVPQSTAPVDSGVASSTSSFTGPDMPTTNTSGIQTNNVNWAEGSDTVGGDFDATYGQGTGTAITDVLQNMGTSTDAAIQATIAQTDTAANQQYGNIQAQEAAGGVSPNSSTAALASSNFYNQVNEGLQSTISGDEMSEENTLLSALTNEGTAHGGDPSVMDSIMGGIGDAATLGSDASSLAGLL